jgi:nucleotide-binding universal stress UspA family protein
MPIFNRLLVLLDDGAPSRGAFAHALEWAWHLRLPIHAWALPTLVSRMDGSKQAGHPSARFLIPLSDEFDTGVNACAKLCAEWGVKLGLTPIADDPIQWLRQNLQADDLLMVSHAAARTARGTLAHILQQPAAVLICPEAWRSTLSRMLFLYRSDEHNQEALATVMDLCRWVRATPVVLTVARTQREGSRLQEPARKAFAEHHQSGDFDLCIGGEVVEAAARVARWRQCHLLVMGRYGRRPWRRWFEGSTTERLVALADSFAVLTIPKTGVLPLKPDRSNRVPLLRDPSPVRRDDQAPERNLAKHDYLADRSMRQKMQ